MANIILTPSQIWEYSGAGDSLSPDYQKQYGHYLALDDTLKSITFLALDAPLTVASCNIDGFNNTDFQGQKIPLWRAPEPYVDGQYDLQYDAAGTTFYSHLKMHFGNVTHFKILILYRLNNYWHGLDMTTKYLISEPKTTWDGYATIGDVVSDTIPIPSQSLSPTQGGYVTDNAGSIWAAIAGHEINQAAAELYVGDVLFRPSVPWDNPRELYYGILIEINDDFEFIGYDEIPVGPTPPDPGSWGDDSEPAGGDGTFTAASDNRPGSTIFSDANVSAWIQTLDDIYCSDAYNIYQLQNQTLGDVLGTFYGTDFWSRWENYRFNPLSAVLALHEIPAALRADVRQTGTPPADIYKNLTAAGFDISAHMQTPQQFPVLRSIKVHQVGGKVHDLMDTVGKYFGAYPDFAPYTRMILHLPYIGALELDTNACMYGTLDIRYVCDNTNGNVAAFVICKDRTGAETAKYVQTGNCAVSIPLFAQTQNGAAVGKMLSGAVSGIAGLAVGNPQMIIGGVSELGSGAIGQMTASVGTSHTGGVSGNMAAVTDSVCWLEVIRPQWCNPHDFPALNGLTLNVSGTLSDLGCTGRTVVSAIESDGIQATEPEIAEIERLLRSGVFIKIPEE